MFFILPLPKNFKYLKVFQNNNTSIQNKFHLISKEFLEYRHKSSNQKNSQQDMYERNQHLKRHEWVRNE